VTRKVALRLIDTTPPVSVEDTDTGVVDGTEDANTDVIDTTEVDDGRDISFDRLPIPNDDRWQETIREWIDIRRDRSIPLKQLLDLFAETVPLDDATRRWFFDFEESGHLLEMKHY